ncbi:MAG: hypothetical protein GTO16_00270 [Candidatus Aminicenantes bacterium]|nr:hypothetical protein [Candidatus Aminicenantes bacterium]
MRRPDLLILIAVWEFLTAFGSFVGLIFIAVFAFPEVSSVHGISSVGGIFGLSIAVLVLLFYLCIAIAGGIGLLGGKEWGRVLSLVHAAISLLWIPFGTIIGILIIVYLIKPEIRDYFESVQK